MFKANELCELRGSFNHVFNIENLYTMARHMNRMIKEINRLEHQVEYLTKVMEERKNDTETA